MRYDLVVFDLAGTTVHDGDSVAGAIALAMRERASVDLETKSINSVMGMGTKPLAIAELLRRFGSDASERLVAAVHARFEERMLEYYRTSPEVREVEGTSRLLAALRAQGVKVGLDTAFSRAITDTIFQRLGWRCGELYDASCTAAEVRQGRPAPYMIYRLMEAVGAIDVGRVAKVGDTPSDLREGTNAGCGGVFGVTWGSHRGGQLVHSPHTRLLSDPEELYEALGLTRRGAPAATVPS